MCVSAHAVVSPSANPTSRRVRVATRSTRVTAGFALEAELWSAGYRAIAGVDEVGRGPWAGPVVAAAVILPHGSRRSGAAPWPGR